MDNLETHDERLVLRRTCFSIEPGIYFDEFGVRSEVNVFVDARREVHVTGGLQTEVLPILGHMRPSSTDVIDRRADRELPGQDSNLEKQDQNLL